MGGVRDTGDGGGGGDGGHVEGQGDAKRGGSVLFEVIFLQYIVNTKPTF